MTDRDEDDDQLNAAEISVMGGGRVLVPDSGRIPKPGRQSENEQDAEFDREDDGLLDPESPEFDHSLRTRK